MSDLGHRYRRLLWAYPRAYRHARGEEIVTTLLDAAPADRTRPTGREAFDLLRGGLRYRLRVRDGAAALAALVAFFAAVAGGSLGGFLGWQTAPDLPPDAAVLRMLGPALPAGASPAPQRWDFVFDDDPAFTNRWEYWIGGTDEYRHGKVFVDVPATGQAQVDAARAGLAGAGWRVADESDLVAYRDGWRAEVGPDFQMGREEMQLRFAITRTTPAATLPLALAGLLLGGLAGWLGIAGAARRVARATPERRAAAVALTVGALLTLLPATALSGMALAGAVVQGADPVPVWIGYAFLFFRGFAWLGVLLLLAAVIVVATGRPAPVRAEWPRAA
jgi:hypothetical protein